MPVQSYFDNLEPDAPDAEIWRFQPFKFFEDLMASEELYFRRADVFVNDEREGIPSEDYIRRVMGLRKYDVQDERTLLHQMGTLAQDRESFYVSCWHLHRHETAEMWKEFGQEGVAIRCRYDLLKSIMDDMLDTKHLGAMRYGEERLRQTGGVNVLQFINTKRQFFHTQREVRALIWHPDPFDGKNRHYGVNNFPSARPLPENPRHQWVSEFKRRRIDLKALITGVVVSAWATKEVLEMSQSWVRVRNHSYEVQRSSLAIA